MFIVWRKKPVKGQGGGPFLRWSPNYDQRFAFWDIRCEHKGTGRTAHTALVVASERRDGKPRQKLYQRFPTIRSCCIADPFVRAAWWYRVDYLIESWGQSFSDDPLCLDYSRDIAEIRRSLLSVVAKPSRKGLEVFTAYRLARVVEHQAWREAESKRRTEETEYWRREHQRRREQEQEEARRATQGQWGGQNQRFWEEFANLFGGPSNDRCFSELGLTPNASIDDVKRRHRELAMKHHPDRGGDAKEFARVQTAYERACDILTRRASA
jgi:DnaJ-domain-containing protein 1